MIDRCDLTLSRVVPRSGVSEIGGAMKTSSRPPTISPCGFDEFVETEAVMGALPKAD